MWLNGSGKCNANTIYDKRGKADVAKRTSFQPLVRRSFIDDGQFFVLIEKPTFFCKTRARLTISIVNVFP